MIIYLKLLKSPYDRINGIGSIFQILAPIASAQPHLFDKHRLELIDYTINKQSSSACQCLQTYAIASVILGDETTADEYLTLALDLIKTTPNMSNDMKFIIFNSCQTIGVRYKRSLVNKRHEFLAYESHSTCRMLIDFIDGTQTTEEFQATINRTLEDLNHIEKRIVHTETNVQTMKKSIQQQELYVSISLLLFEMMIRSIITDVYLSVFPRRLTRSLSDPMTSNSIRMIFD